MKRICAFVMTIFLLVNLIPAGSAEEKPEIRSYDFSLRFHLESREYPFRQRQHVQGYEELLEILELKGTVSRCEETDSTEIYAELIPASNASAKIWFRLFGKSDRMCIESPLLGPEPYYLGSTYEILYFCSQFWLMTGLPLPALVLMNPNNTLFGLHYLATAWTKVIPPLSDGQIITVSQIQAVWESWKEQVQNNKSFLLWMDGFYTVAPGREPIEEAVVALPDVLLNVANGKDLKVRRVDGALRCENADGDFVFEEKTGDHAYSFYLAPTNTGTKYKPEFYYNDSADGNTRDLSLRISLDRSEPGEDPEEKELDSLLKLQVDAAGIPTSLPAEAEMSAAVSLGGFIFPEIDWQIRMKSEQGGAMELTVLDANLEGQNADPLFRCYGTVTPAAYEGTLAYEADDLSKYTMLLVASHSSSAENMKEIAPYFVKGIIDFLYELPVRSCQSIMDDLESYGLLLTLMQGL